MDTLSLYDILVGSFLSRGDDPGDTDESYFDQMSEERKLRQSIVENLKMVLQTRRGSVKHLPDFGIPDIMQLYAEEGSIDPVCQAIRETILKYEPRIAEVRVIKSDFDQKNLRLSLKVFARIREVPGKEVLLTEFSSTGWVKVEFERDIIQKESP
ncbi:MAG: type VI secretion system baseplate subunit TssE [Calditrichaeota bacterium]|nr:MAG: type VI secretion system baseplate subunit TssE [Calditrichota bacterium]